MKRLPVFIFFFISLCVTCEISYSAEDAIINKNTSLGITPQEARKLVEKISFDDSTKLENKKKLTETRYKWVPKKKKKDKTEKETAPSWVNLFFKELVSRLQDLGWGLGYFVRIVVFILFIFLIILYLRKIRFFEGNIERVKKKQALPKTLFGMDIRPESIPKNPEIKSLKLWQRGKNREALALLYRSALSILVHSSAIPIHSSFTEFECQKKIAEQATEKEVHYFNQLTQYWIRMAYAHRIVTNEEYENLVQEWKQVFSA